MNTVYHLFICPQLSDKIWGFFSFVCPGVTSPYFVPLTSDPGYHQHKVALDINIRCRDWSWNAVFYSLQTNIGSILAAVNPYKQIPGLYDLQRVDQYSKHHLGELPPHIFAVANECYRCIWKRHDSQCVLIRLVEEAELTKKTDLALNHVFVHSSPCLLSLTYFVELCSSMYYQLGVFLCLKTLSTVRHFCSMSTNCFSSLWMQIIFRFARQLVS